MGSVKTIKILLAMCLLTMSILSACDTLYSDDWEEIQIPQNRCLWPNPAGWGLEPETETYNGLFY